MLKSFFTRNIWTKLFCLFAATVLWLYVSSAQSNIGKFPGSISIRAINTSPDLVAIYDQKTVDIKIMAESAIWKKLSSDSFSAYIDLASYNKEGTYEVPVTVVSSVPEVSIIEKNPEMVLVSLEPIISKEVSVNAKVEGTAAKGLVSGTIDLKPATVQIRGAKSLVENIYEAAVSVKLNNETENFSKNLTVIALDDQGEVVKGIEFTPSEVTAVVPIVKASNNKTVGIKVDLLGATKAGYIVSKVSVEPSVVDITGPADLLSDINFLKTAEIKISDFDKSFDRQIGLIIPDGLALQSGVSSKVKVSVSIEEINTSQTVEVSSIKILNFKSEISKKIPENVELVVSGPLSQLNLASNIVLNLDLANKVADENNQISLLLNEEMFDLPDGFEITQVLTPSIILEVAK